MVLLNTQNMLKLMDKKYSQFQAKKMSICMYVLRVKMVLCPKSKSGRLLQVFQDYVAILQNLLSLVRLLMKQSE